MAKYDSQSRSFCSVRCPQRIGFSEAAALIPLRTADTTAHTKENSDERLARPG